METDITNLHYLVAAAILALIGAVGHFVRGFVNPIPDKLTDSNSFNLIFSDGYSLSDHLFGVEYDDYGYYRLDSFKNFKLSVIGSVIAGMVVIVISESAGLELLGLVDGFMNWLSAFFWS